MGGVASPQRLVPVDASDMIHEVHGFGHEESELQTHLVGFQPRHSTNVPDVWESDAIKRLAEGEPEVSSERTIGGARFLQIIRPLFIEESCLKCHAEQGYRVGELRGGISVSAPFAPLLPVEKAEMLRSVASYGSMWLFGLGSILFATAVATPDRATHRDRGSRREEEKANDRRAATFKNVSSRRGRPASPGSTSPGRRFRPSLQAVTTTITYPCPKTGYAIVVGDVSGHGLGPALLMASARACPAIRSADDRQCR